MSSSQTVSDVIDHQTVKHVFQEVSRVREILSHIIKNNANVVSEIFDGPDSDAVLCIADRARLDGVCAALKWVSGQSSQNTFVASIFPATAEIDPAMRIVINDPDKTCPSQLELPFTDAVGGKA